MGRTLGVSANGNMINIRVSLAWTDDVMLCCGSPVVARMIWNVMKKFSNFA